jgi:hypothetical protein
MARLERAASLAEHAGCSLQADRALRLDDLLEGRGRQLMTTSGPPRRNSACS